jgi:hypothetical protein
LLPDNRYLTLSTRKSGSDAANQYRRKFRETRENGSIRDPDNDSTERGTILSAICTGRLSLMDGKFAGAGRLHSPAGAPWASLWVRLPPIVIIRASRLRSAGLKQIIWAKQS